MLKEAVELFKDFRDTGYTVEKLINELSKFNKSAKVFCSTYDNGFKIVSVEKTVTGKRKDVSIYMEVL